MEVWHLCDPIPPNEAVIALGFFDSVHLGHMALLTETVARAAACGAVCAAFTFPMLPTKGESPLLSLEERLSLIEEAGIRRVILADFSEVQALSPEDFVKKILVKTCHARTAVCGFNFRFGRGAVADAARLSALLPGSVTVNALRYGGLPISTTRIRAALAEGDVCAAADMLGRPYTVSGPVLHGKSFGKHLGFPTANMKPPSFLPRAGVYRTRVTVDGKAHLALSDVGTRPTVEGAGEVRLETFIPDFSGDLYGKTLRVAFLSRIRDERRFASPGALAAQIAKDLEAVIQEK